MKISYENREYDFPDFIIVGAAKSGTSSLFKYLNEHPDIFIPQQKELWFLQLRLNPNKEILSRFKDLPQDLEEYSSRFTRHHPKQLLGEATPSYLMYPEYTIRSIKKFVKNSRQVKILIVLREPIDKILSLYKYNLKIRTEYLSINEALANEARRRERNNQSIGLNYLLSCRYYDQVKQYIENFNHVLVLTFDEFRNDVNTVMAEVAAFLDIDPDPLMIHGTRKVYNRSDFLTRNGHLDYSNIQLYWNFVKYLPFAFGKPMFFQKQMAFFRYLNTKEHHLTSANAKQLKQTFKEDVSKLQVLIQKDLSHWLRKYEA